MKKIRQILKKGMQRITFIIATVMLWTSVAYGAETDDTTLLNSKLVTGTAALLKDLTTWIIALAIPIGGTCITFYALRKNGADEADQKKYNNRMMISIVSTVIAILGSTIIKIVTNYYK